MQSKELLHRIVLLNKEFDRSRDFLAKYRWFVSPEDSPKWWGGLDSRDEIVISAILVQQTRWEQVEKTISEMKRSGVNDLRKIASLSEKDLDSIIAKINFHRSKAKTLIEAARLLIKSNPSREALLSIKGIGEETADSILLFGFNVRTLPINYFFRIIFSRISGKVDSPKYIRDIVLKQDFSLFELKLLYAGLSTVGKANCKRVPVCNTCIIKNLCNVGTGKADYTTIHF
ncbi:DNA endonuclease III [Sulfolobales archaeon HS-7]|nr:DNA endonuclease III [Sulfolobales archaeon HS-7]